MNPSLKRTFIAYRINAGRKILDCLSELRISLKEEKIKWVDPDRLHITLTFIGDTAADQLVEIGKIMEKNVSLYSSPKGIIKGMGVFRSIDNPRVIWLGMVPIPELAELKTRIDKELKTESIMTGCSRRI